MAQEWKKNEHYVVPALRFVFIKVFHILQHVPPAHFGSPDAAGTLERNSLMVQAGWCESWSV